MGYYQSVVAVGLVLAVVDGCGGLHRGAPQDAQVDFAAHPGYRGLVVDRMDGGAGAILVGADPAAPAGPTHLLERDGRTVAALWMADDGVVTVRPTADATAPAVGEVVASSQRGAIRLDFHSADGAAFHTSPFERVDSGTYPNLLGSQMAHWLSIPGVYRAEVFDAHGVPLGWFRVEILPDGGLSRHFDGQVPEPINGPLAVGAAALLNSEIDTLRQTAFPDEY